MRQEFPILLKKSSLKSQVDFLLSRMKRHYVLSGSTLVPVALIFLCFVFGWADLAPRFGAILVALSVFWGVRVISVDTLNREQDIIHFICVEAVEVSKIISEKYNHRSNVDRLPAGRVSVQSDSFGTPKNFAIEYARDMNSLHFFVAILAASGTVVWAFGDWAINIITVCGKIECSF